MDNTIYAAVISAAATLLATIITVYVNDRVKKKKEEDQRRDIVGRVIESSNKAYPVLWGMMNRLRAKRAAIVQFHNGGKFYSGKSIDRFTMTHEVHEDLVPSIKDNFIGVLLEHYYGTLEEIEKNEFCYYPTLDSVKDSSLQNVMKYYNSKSILFVAIRDKSNNTVASIFMSFNKENQISDPEIEAMMLQSNKIRDILI